MRVFSYILIGFFVLSGLQAQDIVRGSHHLKVEEIRSESALSLTLSDSSGRVVYQINRELAYDTPRPAVHLYGDGSVLLVDSFAGVYEYCSMTGQMVSRVPFNGEIRPNHERVTHFSGNDSMAAVLISEPGESESRILLVDRRGSIRLDRPFEGSFASGLLLSPDGGSIAAGAYSWSGSLLAFRTEFFGIDGASIASLDLEFKGGSWSSDGTLFVVYGRDRVSLVDVRKRGVISTSHLGENRIVHDVFWDGSTPFVASSPVPVRESDTWIYPRLAILNVADGRTVYQSEGLPFRSAKLEKTVRGVSATIDGQSIRIK